MSATEHVAFNIPGSVDDTEGMRVAALVMPDPGETLHGFIALPSTVSAENAELVIRAIRACLADLEDNCHNHPTSPMRLPK